MELIKFIPFDSNYMNLNAKHQGVAGKGNRFFNVKNITD